MMELPRDKTQNNQRNSIGPFLAGTLLVVGCFFAAGMLLVVPSQPNRSSLISDSAESGASYTNEEGQSCVHDHTAYTGGCRANGGTPVMVEADKCGPFDSMDCYDCCREVDASNPLAGMAQGASYENDEGASCVHDHSASTVACSFSGGTPVMVDANKCGPFDSMDCYDCCTMPFAAPPSLPPGVCRGDGNFPLDVDVPMCFTRERDPSLVGTQSQGWFYVVVNPGGTLDVGYSTDVNSPNDFRCQSLTYTVSGEDISLVDDTTPECAFGVGGEIALKYCPEGGVAAPSPTRGLFQNVGIGFSGDMVRIEEPYMALWANPRQFGGAAYQPPLFRRIDGRGCPGWVGTEVIVERVELDRPPTMEVTIPTVTIPTVDVSLDLSTVCPPPLPAVGLGGWGSPPTEMSLNYCDDTGAAVPVNACFAIAPDFLLNCNPGILATGETCKPCRA